MKSSAICSSCKNKTQKGNDSALIFYCNESGVRHDSQLFSGGGVSPLPWTTGWCRVDSAGAWRYIRTFCEYCFYYTCWLWDRGVPSKLSSNKTNKKMSTSLLACGWRVQIVQHWEDSIHAEIAIREFDVYEICLCNILYFFYLRYNSYSDFTDTSMSFFQAYFMHHNP